jgi:DNA-directed RNA polymerase subunit E'/Rpb7
MKFFKIIYLFLKNLKMFLIYTIDDKILLKPEELNKKHNGIEISYEDILLSKLKEKYLGKVLLNNGIVVSIKKFVMKNNLIVEIEGLINVEVRRKKKYLNFILLNFSMKWI